MRTLNKGRRSGPASYVSRDDAIIDLCRGKRVLHLGCIGETHAESQERVRIFLDPQSFHSRLSGVASEVIGVDIDRALVRRIQESEPSVVAGDAERLSDSDLPESFEPEVVVAGDIIEHLSNPGLMLEGIKRLMPPWARLVLSTPNAYGLPNYMRFTLGRFKEGADHVHLSTQFTIENLLRRHGYAVDTIMTCYEKQASQIMQTGSRRALLYQAGKRALATMPKFGGTLLVVARPPED